MFQINTTELGNQKLVVTARLSNGNYVAVWSSDEGGADFFDQRTYGQIFKEDGTKVGPEFVVAYQASRPDVTALSDGTFVVVWNDGQGQPLSVGTSDQTFVATKYNNDGSVVVGYESPVTLFDPYYNGRNGELIETQSGELVGFFSLHARSQDNLPGGYDSWETVAQRYDMDLNPIGSLVHVNTSIWGNQWPESSGSVTQTTNGDLVFVWWSSVQSAGGASQAKLRVFDQDLIAKTGEIDLIPSPTLGYVNTVVASLGGGGVAAAYSLEDGVGVKLLDTSYNVVHSFSLSSGGNTFLTKLQREIVLNRVDEETFALTWFEEHPDQTNGQLIDVKTQVFGNDGTPIGEARIVGQTGVGADSLDVEVSNGSLGISFMQVPSASDESVNGDGNEAGIFFTSVPVLNNSPELARVIPGDGYVTTDLGGSEHAAGMVVMPDGRVVIAGWSDTNGSRDFALTRYNPDGSLDTSFGDAGSVITELSPFEDIAYTLTLQADGKLIAGGYTQTADSVRECSLVRYNVDGTADLSFGVGGVVRTDLGGLDSGIYDLVALENGQILVTGLAVSNGQRNTVVAKYNADGTLDQNFGSSGTAITDLGADSWGEALQPLGDSSILVAGHTDAGGFALLKYDLSGALDQSFGNNGVVVTTFAAPTDLAYDLLVQPDGKIVVAGQAWPNSDNRAFALARYEADGTLDVSFGDNGKLIEYFSARKDVAYDVALTPDGKLLAAGFSDNGVDRDFTIVQYNPDGTRDSDFGDDGVVKTNFSNGSGGSGNEAYSLEVLPDGRIVIAGFVEGGLDGDFAVARYNPDGTLDPTFGITYETRQDLNVVESQTLLTGSPDDVARAVLVQDDGKIVVAGYENSGSDGQFTLVRLNPDLSRDSAYGQGGLVKTDITASFDGINSAVLTADQKVVVVGYANGDSPYSGPTPTLAVARYDSAGLLDASFADGGLFVTNLGESTLIGNSVAIQSDGKVVVASMANVRGGYSELKLIRLNVDGTLDEAFGDAGVVTYIEHGQDYANGVKDLSIKPDGSIVITGRLSETDAIPGFDAVLQTLQFRADGSLDTNFADGGVAKLALGDLGFGKALAVEGDGSFVVAMTDVDAAGYVGLRLIRYGSDGQILAQTESFSSGGMLERPWKLVALSDGKLLLSGAYGEQNLQGQGTPLLMRFNSDLTLDGTFFDDGRLLLSPENVAGTATDVAVLENGDLVISGTVDSGLGDKDSVVYAVRESSGVSYTEGAPPVTLDSTSYVKDQELSDLGSYGGSSITFARQGGANAEDHFSLDPKALGVKAGDFKVSELAGFSAGDMLPDGRIATHQDVEAAAQRALHDLLALTAFENPQTDVLTVNAGRAQQLGLPDGSTVVVTTTSDPSGTFSGGVYVTLLDHERSVINQHMVSDGGTPQLRFAQVLSDGDIYIAWGVSGYKAALVSVDDGVITSTAPVTVSSNSSASVQFGALEAPEGLVAFWDEGGTKKAQLLDSSDLTLIGGSFAGLPGGGLKPLNDGDILSASISGSFQSGSVGDDTITFERYGFDYNGGSPVLTSKGVIAEKASEWTGSSTEIDALVAKDGSIVLMWSANGQSYIQRVRADGEEITGPVAIHPTLDAARNYPHISVDQVLAADGSIKAFVVSRISMGDSPTDDGVFLQVYSPDLSVVEEYQLSNYQTSPTPPYHVSVSSGEDGSVHVMWKTGENRVPLDEQTWTNVEVRPEVFDLKDGVEALSATQLSALEASGESAYWSEAEITAAAALTEGNDVVISGQVIGSVTQNSGGQLRIDFASASSEQSVNQAIQAVQYQNVSDDPPATVTIDWTFNDGNSGDQGAGGSAQVTASATVNITALEDPPVPEVYEYNGHYYQVINEAVTWQEAMDLAAGSTYEGVEGHLVTVTSAGEQAFVTNLVKEHVTTGWDNASIWLAASDAQEEGVWRWMAGPESGSNFWAGDGSGSPVAESFSAWINDYVVDENAASGGSGTWTNPEGTGADYVFLDAIYSVDSNWDDAYSSTTASSSLTSPVASGDGLRNAYVVEYSVASVNDAPTLYKKTVEQLDLGQNESLFASAVQSDGKILVGGRGGDDSIIVRYNADLSVDESFAAGGEFRIDLSSGFEAVRSIHVLEDGRIVASNGVDRVFRLSDSGGLDTGFGVNGYGTTNGHDLAQTPDGGFVSVGAGWFNGRPHFLTTKLTGEGEVDAAFGSDGNVYTSVGEYRDYAKAVAVQNDGKIILAGNSDSSGSGGYDFSVVRLNQDGSLDTAFANAGTALVDLHGGSVDIPWDVVIQDDGKILVVGESQIDDVWSVAAIRLNQDGSLDGSFGQDGELVVDLGSPAIAFAAVAGSDEEIFISGYEFNGENTNGFLLALDKFGGQSAILRTNILDVGGNDLYLNRQNHDAIHSDVQLLSSGDLLYIGSGQDDIHLVRFSFDGTSAASYREGDSPVLLIPEIYVSDDNLRELGSYVGSSITLARQGGADPEDRFTSNIGGIEDLSEESTLVVGGVSVGVVTQNSRGQLRIDFAEGSTEELVNEVLQSISYSNTSDTPPTTVAIDWTFDDGNAGLQGSGGALAVTSTTTINITAVNDLPVGETYISGDLYVGQELTLVEGWTDAEGVDGEAHYQWRRLEEGVWVDIAGETGATYTLTSADEGHQVSAAISYLDLGGTDELIEVTKVAGAIQPDSVLNGGGGADVLTGGSGDDVLWIEGNLGNPSEFWGARVVAPGAQASGGSGDDVFRFYTNQSSPWVAKQATIDGGDGVDALGINGEHGFDWDISDLALSSVEELSLAWWQPSNALTVRMTSQQWSMFDVVNVEVANVSSGLTFIVDGEALSTEAVTPKLESFSVVAGDPFDFQGEDEDIYLGTLAEGETIAVAMPAVGRMNEAPDLVMGKGYVLSDMAGADEIGQELLVQSDGRVVVAGLTKLLDADEALALTRFNPDGSLDESFGDGGVVRTPLEGADSRIYGATQLESGQILVSGRTQGDNGFDAVFARYNADGSIDNTFGVSGMVRVDVGDVTTEFRAQAVDASGGVVAVGKAGSEILITRLGPDGQLDTAFGGTGSVVSTLAPDFPAAADVLALADGSVVVGASVYQGTNSNFMLAKYAANGALDPTFGVSGYATVDLGSDFESAYGLIAQSDGGFVLAGYTLVNGTQDFALARFTANGALDTSFGGGGTVVSDLTGRQDVVTSVVTDSSDRIVVAGYSNNGADTDVTIARYLADGSLDATFGDGGWSTLSLPGGQWAYDVAILDDDKIAVAGYSRELVQGQGDDFLLVRFNADGSLDDGFDNDLGREQVENGGPFLLNGGIQVFDQELDAAESYAGSWVTLSRRDAVDASDVFSAGADSSLASLDEGSPVVVGGTEIGLVAKNSGGELRLEFGDAATPALVNLALQGIAYQNTSDAPQAVVSLEWTFGDGNTGEQGGGGERVATAQTQVHITAVNDEPVGGLEITGDFEQGQTLSATEAFDDADGRGSDPLSYQWYRGVNEGAPDDIVVSEWTPVAGAVESTYLLTQADVGFVVSVGGTYVDNFSTPEEVFGEGAVVANVNDLPVGEVYVTGDYVQGQTLVASHDISDIDGLDPDAVAFRWERGLDADSSGQIDEGEWQTISGAYGAQYSLTQDDVDFDVRAVATYTDGQGTVERVVGESSPVTNVNDAPTLTELEQTLPEQTEDDIAGAGQTVSNLLGDSFGDIDTGSAHGVAIHSTSGDFGAWEFSLDGGASWLSVGEVSEGSALLLNGEDSIRWVSDGTRGTTASLEYFAWDQTEFGAGQRIDATQRGGQTSLSVESAVATKVVAEINDTPDGSISLGGTPAPGERLSVVREVTDVDGIIEESVTYRWLIGEDFDHDGEIVESEKTVIAIAEDAQYMIGTADSGKTLFAEMTYLDGGGTTETIQSEGVEVYWPDPELRLVQGDSGQLSIQTGWVGAAWTINYSVLVRGATIDAVTIGEHPAAWSVEANSFNDPLTSQLVVAAYSTGDPSTGYPMVGGGEFISVEVTPHVDASNVTVSILPGATAMYAESDFETEIDTSLSFEIAVGATVSVESADVEVVEGGDGSTTTVEYVIHLDRAVNIDHQIAWSVAGVGGFAVDGEDFAIGEVPSGVLEIKAGETSGVISFEVNGDGLVEGDEAFEVSLLGSSGLNLSGLDTLTGAILNDDKSKVTIDAASTLLPEGDIGVTYYTFDVNLDQAAVVDQSVNWRIDYLNDLWSDPDFLPVSAADFAVGQAFSGVLEFGAGETHKEIVIGVKGDLIKEGRETFGLEIFDPSMGLEIDEGQGTVEVQIKDDDGFDVGGKVYFWGGDDPDRQWLMDDVDVGVVSLVGRNQEEVNQNPVRLHNIKLDSQTGLGTAQLWVEGSVDTVEGVTSFSFNCLLPDGSTFVPTVSADWQITQAFANGVLAVSGMWTGAEGGQNANAVRIGEVAFSVPDPALDMRFDVLDSQIANDSGGEYVSGSVIEARMTHEGVTYVEAGDISGSGSYFATALPEATYEIGMDKSIELYQFDASGVRTWSKEVRALTAADARETLLISLGKEVSGEALIAADVNKSGTVTAADARDILLMSVKDQTRLEEKLDWVFVSEDADLSGLTRRDVREGEDWVQGRTLYLQDDQTSENLVAILMGDVNASYTPLIQQVPEI